MGIVSHVWNYDIPVERGLLSLASRLTRSVPRVSALFGRTASYFDNRAIYAPKAVLGYGSAREAIEAGENPYQAWFESSGMRLEAAAFGMDMSPEHFEEIFLRADDRRRTPALIAQFCFVFDKKFEQLSREGRWPDQEIVDAAISANAHYAGMSAMLGTKKAIDFLTQLSLKAQSLSAQPSYSHARQGATHGEVWSMFDSLCAKPCRHNFENINDLRSFMHDRILDGAKGVLQKPISRKKDYPFPVVSNVDSHAGFDDPYFAIHEGRVKLCVPSYDAETWSHDFIRVKWQKALINWLENPQTKEFLHATAVRLYVESKGYGIRWQDAKDEAMAKGRGGVRRGHDTGLRV